MPASCGKSKPKILPLKKIEVTITGLDGNEVAEKSISDELLQVEGVKTISFNYLNNQVVVLFDTTLVNQSEIISVIMKANEGKHKVLDVKENKEPVDPVPDVKPNPQEDIHDDLNDEFQDNA